MERTVPRSFSIATTVTTRSLTGMKEMVLAASGFDANQPEVLHRVVLVAMPVDRLAGVRNVVLRRR